MIRKIDAANLPEFDLAEMLKTEQDIATYLTLATEEGNDSELSHALGIAARARGMTVTAKGVGPLVDFMRNSPLHGVEVAFERDTSLTRTSPL